MLREEGKPHHQQQSFLRLPSAFWVGNNCYRSWSQEALAAVLLSQPAHPQCVTLHWHDNSKHLARCLKKNTAKDAQGEPTLVKVIQFNLNRI